MAADRIVKAFYVDIHIGDHAGFDFIHPGDLFDAPGQ